MGVPLGAITWAAIGGLAAFRTFYRPHRAVVRDGFALRCAAAESCDPTMTIESFIGKAPVYANSRGRVLFAGPNGIQIAAADEPTVLTYEADARGGFSPQVRTGDRVGIGQQIALASRVRFGVEVIWREPDGELKRIWNEPASWLAARGQRISAKYRKADAEGSNWCEGGRRLVVPPRVGTCKIRLPTPGAFALLPVSVTMG